MRAIIAMAALLSSAAAAEEPASRIVVSGSASVSTPPDVATIDWRVTGEGATSDAAVAAMVARQARIAAGLATIDAGAQPRSSEVAVTEVRGPDCRRDGDDDAPAPRLSTGKCAIVGYLASMDMSLRTAAAKDAGTIVGLLGRLEASRPHLNGFALADPDAAQRRAVAAALLDARRQAEAIAAGTGVRLGRLLVASTDQRNEAAGDIVVTANRLAAPPALASPPIVVDLTPQPISTRAQVTVTYAVAP